MGVGKMGEGYGVGLWGWGIKGGWGPLARLNKLAQADKYIYLFTYPVNQSTLNHQPAINQYPITNHSIS